MSGSSSSNARVSALNDPGIKLEPERNNSLQGRGHSLIDDDEYYEWHYQDENDVKKEVEQLAREHKRWQAGIWASEPEWAAQDDSSDEDYIENDDVDTADRRFKEISEDEGEDEEMDEEEYRWKIVFDMALDLASDELQVERTIVEQRVDEVARDSDDPDVKLFRALFNGYMWLSGLQYDGTYTSTEARQRQADEDDAIDNDPRKQQAFVDFAIYLACVRLGEQREEIRRRVNLAYTDHENEDAMFKRFFDLCLLRARLNFSQNWAEVVRLIIEEDLEGGGGNIQALIERFREEEAEEDSMNE